jgi:hypothetical protein
LVDVVEAGTLPAVHVEQGALVGLRHRRLEARVEGGPVERFLVSALWGSSLVNVVEAGALPAVDVEQGALL